MSEVTGRSIVFRPLQARFLTIPQAPLCYWLREKFFELLAMQRVSDFARVHEGLAVRGDHRFVRAVWEAPVGSRWKPLAKGGGYGKWAGLESWTVDIEYNAARLLMDGRSSGFDVRFVDLPVWTFSYMARGCLGVRLVSRGLFSNLSASIEPAVAGLAAVLNCRLFSYLVRSISSKIQMNKGYVERLPASAGLFAAIRDIESACISLKRYLVSLDPTERTFAWRPPKGNTLREAWRAATDEAEAVAAVLHTLEGLAEREVFSAYGIEGDDLQAVLDETGTPAGWFPLLEGYDGTPALPDGLAVPEGLLDPLRHEPRRTLSPEKLRDLQQRLLALYEAGPGAREDLGEASEEDEEADSWVSGARIPIPAETFLEELSQKVEVHPISVYWLLRQARQEEGVVSQPELLRFVEDYMSITVLRLLGHQWPSEIEAKKPLPPWADKDGIIPLTKRSGEPPLLERVRERLADDFGRERVMEIEREFSQIVGKPLEQWLAVDFFRRHISQFRKRPIAWQITSAKVQSGGRKGLSRTPAFSCLIYYHRLDGDLLPKVRNQYVGRLRAGLETEVSTLEKTRGTSDRDEGRLYELRVKIDEIRALEERLDKVIRQGFASEALSTALKDEPLDQWTSLDGRTPAPQTRDAFLAQESRYIPDLNDGVRVNIAPLQREGLLAADVLAATDVEKAIRDRAKWRSDERRWCREGKLPKPGWWSNKEA